MNILCTDKTGTLTEDKIVLQKYIDVMGKEDKSILEYAYLNSYFGTGIKNLVDKAVITYGNKHKIKEVLKQYYITDLNKYNLLREKLNTAKLSISLFYY